MGHLEPDLILRIVRETLEHTVCPKRMTQHYIPSDNVDFLMASLQAAIRNVQFNQGTRRHRMEHT